MNPTVMFFSVIFVLQTTVDTVLHAAARKKDVDIAKILVENGCPVDLQNVILSLVVLVACIDNKTLWSAHLGYQVGAPKREF